MVHNEAQSAACIRLAKLQTLSLNCKAAYLILSGKRASVRVQEKCVCVCGDRESVCLCVVDGCHVR